MQLVKGSRTRPLAGVNGEVCIEKRKKDLTRASIVRDGGVSWSVDGLNGGNATSGAVSATGLFTTGSQAGVHTVTATSNSIPL
jgi:hypothetical protein